MKITEKNHRALERKVRKVALRFLREHSHVEFWENKIVRSLSDDEIAKFLDLPQLYRADLERHHGALHRISIELQTCTISYSSHAKWERPGLVIAIKNGFEWEEVIREAWKGVDGYNPHYLSENATSLLEWAKSDKNKGVSIRKNTLGRSAYLMGAGSYDGIQDCLIEIQRKADPTLRYEIKRESWREQEFKIWFSAEARKPRNAENPILDLEVKNFTFTDLERLRVWLNAAILSKEFAKPDEYLMIYEIEDRKTFRRCFPKLDIERWPKNIFAEFLNGIELIEGLKFACSFEKGEPWVIAAVPVDGWTWEKFKTVLRTKESEIPIEKKYGLSADAAALLKWILSLKKSDYIQKFTPPIEAVYKIKIGITVEWDKDNIPAYVQILLDEINEKTEYNLKVQRWKHWSTKCTRISVDKKTPEIDQIVRQIQILGLQKNKVLEISPIKTWLEQLCG